MQIESFTAIKKERQQRKEAELHKGFVEGIAEVLGPPIIVKDSENGSRNKAND